MTNEELIGIAADAKKDLWRALEQRAGLKAAIISAIIDLKKTGPDVFVDSAMETLEKALLKEFTP